MPWWGWTSAVYLLLGFMLAERRWRYHGADIESWSQLWRHLAVGFFLILVLPLRALLAIVGWIALKLTNQLSHLAVLALNRWHPKWRPSAQLPDNVSPLQRTIMPENVRHLPVKEHR